MPLQEPSIANRAPGGVQSDQVKRRRICGAVIGRVRNQFEMRKFAIAHLMQYLAGLSIPVVVLILCLQRAEDLQCSSCKLRVNKRVLQRDDQTVAAERGHEPRESCGRKKDHVIGACDWQAERSHILECLAKQTIKFFVAGLDLDNLL